jgi:hypothetical protein
MRPKKVVKTSNLKRQPKVERNSWKKTSGKNSLLTFRRFSASAFFMTASRSVSLASSSSNKDLAITIVVSLSVEHYDGTVKAPNFDRVFM